ncbi:MAG: hemoglobin/transferrin/lactoferrin receptor protein [Planctomycetota bacterium]|jgi:hemoglobin/transferrin/lactoferrin receptor protein
MKFLVLFTILLALCGRQSWSQETGDGLKAALQEHAEASKEAQQDDLNQGITDLEDTVVTAGRTEQSVFETAGSIRRLNGDDLDTIKTPATFPDAFRRLPGVAVQKTGPGLGSPFIRGFTGFRTALTVDGIRINHSAFRDGPNQYWATVDALGLDRIEVLNGPAGVLHGSDAAGGVVAAFTEPVELGTKDGAAEFAGRLYYRFNSAENSHVSRSEVGVGHDGVFGAKIGLTYKSFGETNAGGSLGRQEGLSYDAYFLNAKFQYLPSDDVSLELLVQSVHLNNVPRIHSTTDGVSFNGTTVGSDRRREFDQDRDLVALTATVYDGSFFDEAIFKTGYQSQTEVQDRIRSSGRRDRSGFDLDTFFVTAQFQSLTPMGRLVYGMDLYIDWVDSFSTQFVPTTGTVTRFAQGPVGDGAQYLTFGVYVENTFDLGSWGRLSLGARYSHVNAQADTVFNPVTNSIFELDESFDAIVGSAKLIVDTSANSRVYTSASMGFRAPNLSDLTRFDSARSNEIEIPATDLDKELFLGLELGANWRSDNLRAHGALFYTFLFDTIIRSPTGDVIDNEIAISKSNVGDGHVLGAEFSVAWDITDELTLGGNFSWLDGQVDTFPTSAANVEAEAISRLAPIQGLITLDYRPVATGLTVSAEVELVDRADRLNTRDKRDTQRIPTNGTPGYIVFNLRTNYAFDSKKSVFLHFENIGDKNYRVHGSGSQESGFAAILGFDLRF